MAKRKPRPAAEIVQTVDERLGIDRNGTGRKPLPMAPPSLPLPPPPPPPPPPTPRTEDPPEYQPGNSRASFGRLAVHVQRRPIDWLVPDLVPRAALTFLVGVPSCGKSSFGSWLCSIAKRPAILPGCEESVESGLVPRLVANNVALGNTLILDGRQWSMPHDRGSLVQALQTHEADLLWIDPVDSYVGECGENDGQGVRAALEALVLVAHQVPCAVVAARHPGKTPGNICPGSRQWYAVPRQILTMTLDHGPPLRRFLTVAKQPTGIRPLPREFNVGGEPGEPGRFTLGPEVSPSDLVGSDESDQVERWKIDQAQDFLMAILQDGEKESAYVFKAGEAERFTDRSLRKAAERAGVKIRREGVGREHKSVWYLPTPATPALPHRDTIGAAKPTAEGVPQTEGRSAGVPESKPKKGGRRGKSKTS